MEKVTHIQSLLRESINVPHDRQTYFFKTGVGQYGEHDQFIGVKVPTLRQIAKTFSDLDFGQIEVLLQSPINEERFLALVIVVEQYKRAKGAKKEEIYQFYLKNLHAVNNWNLVDTSAHLIIGAHLLHGEKDLLFKLAKSNIMWERRIAIVSTWYFIRHSKLEWTFELAQILLHDDHDLIHKAVGWMLREAGQKDESLLISFLDQHAHHMPRTMLRYSIEKFQEDQRKAYLKRDI